MLTLKKGAPLHLISFQYRTLIIVTSQESAEFCWHSTQFVWSALLQTRKNYFKTNLFWVKDMYRWRGRQQNTTLSFPSNSELWNKKFIKSFLTENQKKFVKMVADKKLRSSDKEEELLLQDFSRRVSAKSSALFYGNAFIVSGMANIVVFISNTQSFRRQNCSKLQFF